MAMSPSFGPKSTSEEVANALRDHIKGKNVFLVGASVNSLGGEFLRVIVPYAGTIWVAGRSKERVQNAVDVALSAIPSEPAPEPESSKPTIHIVEMDTTESKSIRAAADRINAQGLPIDVLLSTVMVPQSHQLRRNSQGHELQFAGNYLGTFLLVSLLFPRLKQAGPGARVVQVSSKAHNWSPIRWEDPDYKLHPEEYAIGSSYGWSKLAILLFNKELAKRGASEGILAYALHPGSIITNGVLAVPKDYLSTFGALGPDGSPNKAFFTKTLAEGASTYVYAAFDPFIKDKSGAYLGDCEVHNDRVSKLVTEEAAERFWALTEELVGVKLF